MKRCVCETKDGYINIPAEKLTYDNDHEMFFVYNEGNLVASFDFVCVFKIYLSEAKQ